MKDASLTIVKFTAPWLDDYYSQTPNREGIINNYKFEINNDCDECDYWIVWGGVKKVETVKCPSQNVFYVADEAYEQRTFNQDFLNQFAAVVTCRNDISHPNVIKNHDVGIWHFNKTYDELKNFETDKEHKISVVCSDKTWLPGHKRRFAFVNKLYGHFKDKVHFYGTAFNPINDKFKAIAPYEFSIAIENNVLPDYFTEKIFELYLSLTIPIYYGCPNVSKYFNPDSFISIDINDFDSSVKVIEELVEDHEIYNQKLKLLRKQRDLVLNRYHLFPSLTSILMKNFSSEQNKWLLKENIKIETEDEMKFFIQKKPLVERVLYKVKSKLKI